MSGAVGMARVSAPSQGHLVPAGDRDGRVHSVFTRSCNLAVDDQLLTVHSTETPHPPTTVRVAPGWTPRTHPGDPVTPRRDELSFGAHVIDLHAAQVWSPADRRWSPTHARTDSVARRVAEQREAHCEAHCAAHRHVRVSGLDAAVAGLVRALVAGQEDPAEHVADLAPVVARLIGLGPGVAGAFSEALLDLTDALLGGAPAALTALIRRVLAIGASSGADAVLGLLTALDLALGPDRGPGPDSLDDAPHHEKVA